MHTVMMLLLVGSLSFAGASAVSAEADGGAFVKPQARDKCPVCGMFVAKYPDWTAEIVFADGTYAVFDGTKDLFRYYFGLAASAQGKRRTDISAIFVTDYYSLRAVDGRTASFVLGSDVYGPMGKELVPFGSRHDAQEFLKDHHGQRVLSFDEITQTIIEELVQ